MVWTTGVKNNASDGSLLKQVLPRLLAERVLLANRPLPVLLPLINQYSIEGLPTSTLRLNRWADHGAATSATEGVTFSTETELSMGTEVDLTPTEAAMMLAKITDYAVEKTGLGYANALELFHSGDIESILAVIEPEAINLTKGIEEKLEKDIASLFTSFTNTAGAVGSDMSLSTLEAAIFTADTLEQPHTDRVCVLGPRGVSDLRKELMVTSGGAQGVMWGNTSAPIAANAPAGQVGEIWVPIYQISQSIVPVSGTVPGAGGHVGALLLRGVGNPEQAGGSGQVGSIAMCEGRGLTFATDFSLRDRALDVAGIHKYAVAVRAQDLAVGILYDDA